MVQQNGDPKTAASHELVISTRQSTSIIASTIIGVGVLTLPRVTAEYAGQAGWLSTILGTIVAMIAIYMVTRLGQRFPGRSIAEYGSDIIGISKYPVIGRILFLPIGIGYILYWGFSTAIVARIFGEVVITTVLVHTPLEISIITMLIIAFVLSMYEVEVLARVNEILLPIIIIPVLVIALSSYQSARLDFIFPLFEVSWMPFLMGLVITFTAYLGFEIMTVFLAYTKQSDKLVKSNLIGIAFPGLIYTLIVIAGISVFGAEELALLSWPTLELVKTTEVPGLVLERLESAFLGVWVAAVFTTVGNLYYVTTLMIKQVLRVKSRRWTSVALLPLFYWVSMQPQNILELFQYQTYLSYVGIVVAIVVPLVLLLVAILRKKEDMQQNKGGSSS